MEGSAAAAAAGNGVNAPTRGTAATASASGGATAAGGRARAGTMPSTFLLNDSLLSPSLAAGDARPPELLRRRLSGLNGNNASSNSSNTGSMTPPIGATAGSNTAVLSSILRESQPVSPDPVAAARLRSGSLTLPPSGLGNAFTPGVFGPPGSWTPRSGGIGTPLAMPSDPSFIIPEEAQSSSARHQASSPDGPQAAAILDFLGLQDSPAPKLVADPSPRRDQTRLRSPSQPPPSSLAMGSVASSSSQNSQGRRVSPPGTAGTSMSTGALLVPGRMHSGSLSVPSSCHPSIANLRQTYQDHSSMSSSSGSAPTSSEGIALSPATVAARLRASTLAGDPYQRNTTPSFQFSPSHGQNEPLPPVDPPTRTLADLSLEVEAAAAFDQASGGPAASSSAYLLNRPRASTFSILDDPANPSLAHNRRRAGTTAAAGLLGGNSLLRTPLYEGGADGYLDSAPLAETEEEYEEYENGAVNHTDSIGQQERSTERSRTPPLGQASRSLWIGNVGPQVTAQDLMDTFSLYGAIETVRLLPEKECAFVNYMSAHEAVQAKEDILNRLGGQIRTQALGTVTIRIGFGKQESAPATPATALHGRAAGSAIMATPLAIAATAFNGQESSHLQTSPTRALWIGAIPGTTSSTDLLKVFSPYGPIESARVLANKNCGFCNFENLDDAVRARRALNGLEFLGDDVGPVKIGYARVPNKMPDTASLDNEAVDPVEAYNSLKRLTGATAVPLDEQISSGHLENFRSPMALQMAANNLNGIAPHSATALTASLQPAAGLSPSLVTAELEVPMSSPSVPVHDISEQQLLMRELSGGAPDTEAHVQSITEPRPQLAYHSSIPPPVEDQFWARARNMDAPRLRDIRKRLEAPASQVPQAEVDGLAMELIEDIVPLASDYIGNVIVQKLFEKSSSGPRLAMLERLSPFLASIACHKNGTWAAQKILDVASSPAEISLICHNLHVFVPALLLDQYGNYAAQLCLRFYSPVSDFIFDAMVDRCWEIASGRFGARSMRTCLENPNATRLQHKRVATAIILNSVLLAANANGALLLTWLLDTSNLPGRFRLLATRLAPHLAQLCSHKVASTTVLKLINQKIDPGTSQLLLETLFKTPDTSILEDILAEQVHGSSFMYKLLGSAHVDRATKEIAVSKVRSILQAGTPHHSPAYAKLCNEVGLQAPAPQQHQVQTPPAGKQGSRYNGSSNHTHQTPGPPPYGYPNPAVSPAFNFPAFGSPLSPANGRSGGRNPSPSPGFAPRQTSPYQPMFGAAMDSSMAGQGYYYGHQYNPYVNGYPSPMSATSHDRHSPNASGRHQDDYMRTIAAMQMQGYPGALSPNLSIPYPHGFSPSPSFNNPGIPYQHQQPQQQSKKL